MASTMNFEICHFADFLSISSPLDVDKGYPFLSDHASPCNGSMEHEMPSIFPISATATATTTTTNGPVFAPLAFMALLVFEWAMMAELLSFALRALSIALGAHFTAIRKHFASGWTLTFVGIKPPAECGISSHSMFPRVDTTRTIQTVSTSLQPEDRIVDLKAVIRATYSIPDTVDIVVFFANHLISNETLTLSECGIADRSLLTLALCSSGTVARDDSHFTGYVMETAPAVIRSTTSDDTDYVEFDPRAMNSFFEMYDDDDSSDDSSDENDAAHSDEKREGEEAANAPPAEDPNAALLGFDVVTQEDGVAVHKMAKCGHEMNPESLYHYALSQYADKNNLAVGCPHFYGKYPCPTQWDYHDILAVLRRDGGAFDLHKLELLAARNRVQSTCNVQKCPRCSTLYFQNDADAAVLGDIDSKEDVERAFKSECIYCSFLCTKWEPKYEAPAVDGNAADSAPALPSEIRVPRNALHRRRNAIFQPIRPHIEEAVEELIDGEAVNALFGHFVDSDADTDTDTDSDGEDDFGAADSDEEEQDLIIQRIEAIFDDDAEDEGPNPLSMAITAAADCARRGYVFAASATASLLEAMAVRIHSVYHHLSTISVAKMAEDLDSAGQAVDALLLRHFQSVTSRAHRCALAIYAFFAAMKFMKRTVESVQKTDAAEAVSAVVAVPRHGRRRETVLLDEADVDLFDGGIFEDGDSDSDDDSEAEEEEIIERIERMFDDDDISEPEEEEKEVFGHCKVTSVHNAFCWGCGEGWSVGHVCDSSFKRDLCDILAMAEKKTIGSVEGVPSIRCCPSCCQLISHVQACKHMDCKNCRKSFCFVCLKPRLDSGWQCGSYSNPCPVAAVQGMESLPDAIVITKNAFNLY